MKVKFLITAAALSLITTYAGAQTMYDAFWFSDNYYSGSARTVAMGNAFTALGGDLGAIGLNPAGSSVNKFSQVTVTPNLSILTTGAGFNANPSSSKAFGGNIASRKNTFYLPNLGVSMNFRTGRHHGIKSMTFGIVMNGTSNYMDKVLAYGTNDQTSMLASLAAEATANGVPSSQLNSNTWEGGYDWRHMVAYQSGMISTIDAAKKKYLAATEKMFTNSNGKNEIALGGPLDQTYARSSYGFKYDIITNFGMNISDRIHLGLNLGITTLSYERDSYFREEAVNPDDFVNNFNDGTQTKFMSGLNGDYYMAEANGAYLKFGIIALPINGLRIGAAIQTPTMMGISEKWQYRGETKFSDRHHKASSDMGLYDYRLMSPYRANFGVAYTNKLGLISVDYEFCDYSMMRFKERGTNIDDQFNLVNRLNRQFFGFQHNLRVGAEVRLPYQLSVRAGYNLITSPERTWRDSEGTVDAGVYEKMYHNGNLTDNQFREWENSLRDKEYVHAYTQSIAFGLGWQSKRSFFCDLACRGTFRPVQYTYPYNNYLDDGVSSPEIRVKSHMWDILLTLGWRF